MEVRELHIPSLIKLQELYDLQQRSYQVEASVLGFTQLPPLQESFEELRHTKHKIFVLQEKAKYIAVIFLEKKEIDFVIAKLFVDPNDFRRGLATTLLQHVIKLHPTTKFYVTAATENRAAIRLYENLDFKQESTIKTKEGIELTSFVYSPT